LGGSGAAGVDLSKAIVVCGYGEVGRCVCEALEAAPTRPSYVAFDLDPARISAGVLNEEPVVYGDGASESVLRAVGVESPRAILITYASYTRRVEATSRLRKAFPEVEIYVRTARIREAARLEEAGATRVVVEATESAARFGEILGLRQGQGMGQGGLAGTDVEETEALVPRRL
jgi:CPA2 family monovalent cation:H+ antiporter-2